MANITAPIPTKTLPLTSTFTPPADCWETRKLAQWSTQWFIAPGANTASCFPQGFPFSETSIIYLPGICPAGWTSACASSATIETSTLDVTYCCPQFMGCVPRTSLDSWKTKFGCVSHYDINSKWQSVMKPGPYLSSIYQRHIMIVTASTTNISSLPVSTPFSAPSSAFSHLASNTASATTTDDSATSMPAQVDNRMSRVAMAGIAIGASVGTAIMTLLAYGIWMIKRKQAAQLSVQKAIEAGDYSQCPWASANSSKDQDGIELHEVLGDSGGVELHVETIRAPPQEME
ncbi:unnamed protein product [Periconia digitata]|uniref:Uncharacterized protein n=1 Tax=Periconia digitata TaxID=1303443 RepID=A0A9W4UD20_9PLEO|nr:unnamed protein product [Periconia digitata]